MNGYIELKDVSYTYPKSGFSIKKLNLSLKQGEITGIIGSNGSGKTTIGKIMMGIVKPTAGAIEIDGLDASSLKLSDRGAKIGYAFQNPDRQLFAASVFEEITFPLEIKGMSKCEAKKKAEALLYKFDLWQLKGRIPMRLSRGEKQRLVLASILAQKPGYLILDEPSTGLDRDRRQLLYCLLKNLSNEGIGMAVITHDLQFIKEYTDRIITMGEGRVIKDDRNH
ncbi:MAG: energy-coupling factor ABC transporter ATP-binding protein [Acetobacterium sp.]